VGALTLLADEARASMRRRCTARPPAKTSTKRA
jgi:hypothetical protein